MKENNTSVIKIFKILNSLIVILIILNLLMYLDILPYKYQFIPPYFTTIFIVVLILICSRTGHHFYSIDTKGETLTFETKNLSLFSLFGSDTTKIDLPKYKLIKYEFENGIISKKLIFYINSRKNPANQIKIKFRLAFIPKRNLNNILNELDQIVDSNSFQKDNLQVVM